MDLKVKLPMDLYIDNKGVVDFTANWNTGGRMRHIDVRYYFLRELREEGVIKVHWIDTAANESDLFTKNLGGPEFDKHASKFVR